MNLFYPNTGWHGYADAKPSESIQKHELPGLAVAVTFPYMPDVTILALPVKQYKDYNKKQKADRARRLCEWLSAKKELGLVLSGIVHAHKQHAAATLGLELIEELPDTHVESHYNTYHLLFGGERLDFAQAVALEYYFFTIIFGAGRAATRLPPEYRKLFVAMDRFPGSDTNDAEPGKPAPPTKGDKLFEFIRSRSATGKGILEDNRSRGIECKFSGLSWWRPGEKGPWKKGKSHPHFVLPDWLCAAAIAHEFPSDFVASFEKERIGNDARKALAELYNVCKLFDMWSMDSNVLPHIRANEKLWHVPDDAREFILTRAERCT